MNFHPDVRYSDRGLKSAAASPSLDFWHGATWLSEAATRLISFKRAAAAQRTFVQGHGVTIVRMPVPTSIHPWLSVRDGARALEFYKAAFGAKETYLLDGGDQGIVARLSIDGAEFWVADESPASGNPSPESIGGSPVRMILIAADPDLVFTQAIRAGATEIHPVSEGHGWRIGRIKDPFGHHWEIGYELKKR